MREAQALAKLSHPNVVAVHDVGTHGDKVLRELSRRRTCWPSDAEARKLQTKALMELGDYTACLSAGQGLTDKEVVQWRKYCQQRAG